MPDTPAPPSRAASPRRLAAAAAVWLAALLLTLALAPYLQRVNFVLFWIAVLYAAWHVDFRTALLSAVASVLSVQLIFPTTAGGSELEGGLALAIFLGAAGLVSRLAAQRAHAHDRAHAMERSLVQAVRELEAGTLQLSEQQVELEQQMETAQALAVELEATNEQMHEAMREAAAADQRVRGVLDSLTDAVISCDAEWRVRFMNHTAREGLRQMGRDPAAMLGEVVWERIPELVGTRFETEARRAAREGRMVEFQEHLPAAGKWLENRVVPAEDGLLTTYSRDITHRYQALASLRANEARYRALVEASTAMVWLTTDQGVVEDMPFWRELTGQSVEEVRGNGWVGAVHPDDQARVADAWWRAFQRRALYECEFRVRHRDGSMHWYRARAVPVLNQAGALSEWVGVLIDIDAERRAAAGRTLLDHASRLLEHADEVAETLGRVGHLAVTPPAPVGGVPAEAFADGVMIHLLRGGRLECVTVESRDPVRRELGLALESAFPAALDAPAGPGWVLASGRSELVERFDPARIASNPRHLNQLRALDIHSALVVPLRVRGETLGTMALVLHGPDRRRPYGPEDLIVAQELARRAGAALDGAARVAEAESERERAEAASRAKSDFLASMSHELRTPLNAIAGYAELIELGIHGPVTAEQREAIGRIQKAQRVLLRLINDVLNLARLEAGAVEYQREPVPLDAVLGEVDALVAPQLGARGLHYDSRVAAGPVPVALADRDKVQQVVLNLLSNAVKFTEPGGEVRVEGSARGEWVVVQVRDTGRGIPRDKLDAVFEPFVQVEQGYTRTTEGTGLGLAISRDLARAMGGNITVESEVGRGSVFTVTLPAADA